MVVHAGAEEADLLVAVPVAGGQGGDVLVDVLLGHPRGQVERAPQADRLGDRLEQVLERADADRGQHLPAVGSATAANEPYAEVESVKAVSDVVAPLSGEIVEVNDALKESPEKVNEDPYGEGWMVKVRLTDESEKDQLLDVGAYRDLLSQG